LREVIVWPPYFDASKSRREGRRVKKDAAVKKPSVEEIAAAAKALGLSAKITDGYYPRAFLENGKLSITYDGRKDVLLKRLAIEVKKERDKGIQK